ncbi:MAG: hypothetical protein HYT72_04615 [Candidatus Aenigmarchaeota archaeon]|nr:hypothetical protein [Candidatus Aenigmarchaeota archaeon]
MKDMRKPLVIIFSVAFVLLYAIGSTVNFNVSETCAQVGPCSGCWKDEPVNVSESELCFAPPCIAEPALQRRNAIVDILVCACETAKKKEYTDATLNSQIESAVRQATNGTTVTASQLCENPGILLTKVAYG